MTIKIKENSATPLTLNGRALSHGKAYRLVHDSSNSGKVGNIYIYNGPNGALMNVVTCDNRALRAEDRYTEVDLEILVKERT